MSEPPAYDSRADTLAHIHAVRDNIDLFVAGLLERGRVHDASKLSSEEKPAFDAVLPLLPGVAYGSPEYEALVRRMGPALTHGAALRPSATQERSSGALEAMLEAARALPDLLKARREAMEARWRAPAAVRSG